MPVEDPPADHEDPLGAGWARLLAAARRRLERTGGALDGEIGLTAPDESERRAVIGITGRYRPETARRLSVPLRDMDAYLRRRYGTGLAQTLARLDGPLRDRPAERATEDARRAAVLDSAYASRLAADAWFTRWLDRIAADGTLTRLLRRTGPPLLTAAVRVLERLPEDPSRIVALPVLAEQATGDTKALTSGGPLEHLVLRALAERTDAGIAGGAPGEVPRDRVGRRVLWESAGVVADDLASQVLVLGVGAVGDAPVSRWLREAAEAGIPFRLTLHQLASAPSPVIPAARTVFVCENPAVLRTAAAELQATGAALVCTEGVPSAACHRLLGDAARAGVRLRWRADFDWSGLRITAAALARHGAEPWRMAEADYTAALGHGESTPLAGPPAPSPWDPGLARALAGSGRAVMEERLLPLLLADLDGA
ncbi:TIGR02679 family protein [Actinacidiphila glaucinigra]|uniref:TIGR02679 family protein n=1 Tax=Actinacidiphila glaucinigra TaxID=235986 RepID=UPI00369C9D9E